MNSHKCAALPAVQLQCAEQDGKKVWRGGPWDDAHSTPAAASDSCPPNSLPWRKQVVCNNTGGAQCFTTNFEEYGKAGAVCIVPVKQSEPVQLSAAANDSVRRDTPVSHDRSVGADALLDQFTPCMVHPFHDLSNAAMVSYVPSGERSMCNSMRSDAVKVCTESGHGSHQHCLEMVQSVYKDSNDATYTCALNTPSIPIAHARDGKEWWRWARLNEYDCRSPGWQCSDAALREYNGGTSCTTNNECRASFETGVCDLQRQVCKVGSAAGSRCSAHEDCDHVTGSAGQCDQNGACSKGMTGVTATYHAPAECRAPESGSSLHSYCGDHVADDGATRYTGVCTPFGYGGNSYSACKPFESNDEIARTRAEEMDWQAQRRKPNFYAADPPWQRLDTCPEKDIAVIDGRRVCSLTTQRVRLRGDTVEATDSSTAARQCAAAACSADRCTVGLCTRDDEGACYPAGLHHIAVRQPSPRGA